jgi:hypothetical protein
VQFSFRLGSSFSVVLDMDWTTSSLCVQIGSGANPGTSTTGTEGGERSFPGVKRGRS